MRPLTTTERELIKWFADRVGEPHRRQLSGDLEKARAESLTDDGSRVRFHIEGHTRPPYRYERPLPIDAIVVDADGATLSVVLSEDENGRLYELQLIRYEHGDVIGPDWSSLRLLGPDDVIDLNHPNTNGKGGRD